MESSKKIFKNIINNRNKILLSLILVLFLYLSLDSIFNGDKYKLVKSAKELNEKIKIMSLSNSVNEVEINNGYNIGNKRTKVDGSGVIFLEKDYSFFIGNDNMCVMKLPYSDKIMFQKEKCPNYKSLLGTKFIIKDNNEPGLYRNGKTYIYKGEVDNNYVKYSGYTWRIISINDKFVKMYSTDNIAINNSSTKSIFDSINNRFKLNDSTIRNKIDGIDTIFTFISDSDIKNSYINNKTYFKYDTLLYNNKFMSFKDGNIIESKIEKVSPAIIIEVNDYKDGDGSKNNPFIFE